MSPAPQVSLNACPQVTIGGKNHRRGTRDVMILVCSPRTLIMSPPRGGLLLHPSQESIRYFPGVLHEESLGKGGDRYWAATVRSCGADLERSLGVCLKEEYLG